MCQSWLLDTCKTNHEIENQSETRSRSALEKKWKQSEAIHRIFQQGHDGAGASTTAPMAQAWRCGTHGETRLVEYCMRNFADRKE